MTNSWALLYDELYGDEKMTDEKRPQEGDDITVSGIDTSITIDPNYDFMTGDYITNSTEFDIDIGLSTESYVSGVDSTYFVDTTNFESVHIDTSNYPGANDDVVTFGHANEVSVPPTPSIENPSPRKYQEDKGIKDLQDYISTTYGGHYTSEHNNVQTLDLIESVGDAESFCRSNAIKYLSRYDKKGQGKRDLLKAMHYTLLLYYFSGNTKEPEYTNSRYETF